MIEYPKAFLEDLAQAVGEATHFIPHPDLMPILDVIHNFVNGKYGPINAIKPQVITRDHMEI